MKSRIVSMKSIMQMIVEIAFDQAIREAASKMVVMSLRAFGVASALDSTDGAFQIRKIEVRHLPNVTTARVS